MMVLIIFYKVVTIQNLAGLDDSTLSDVIPLNKGIRINIYNMLIVTYMLTFRIFG